MHQPAGSKQQDAAPEQRPKLTQDANAARFGSKNGSVFFKIIILRNNKNNSWLYPPVSPRLRRFSTGKSAKQSCLRCESLVK
jgi:hypothetical protein